MEKDSDSRNSKQILGDWNFPPVDSFGIVMVSPPSSPYPSDLILEDDDSDTHVMDLGNEPAAAEFDGNTEKEITTALNSSSSVTGKGRVTEKQPVRVSQKKRAETSKSLPLARGKVRVLEERHASAGKARVPSEDGPNFAASAELSSFASQRTRVLEKKFDSSENFSVSEKEPSGAVTSAGDGSSIGKGLPKRTLPPSVAGSEQWGGGKWKADGRKKKMDENDTIPLKQIIEALLRNSGETKEDASIENSSYVEILKSIGIKFPE